MKLILYQYSHKLSYKTLSILLSLGVSKFVRSCLHIQRSDLKGGFKARDDKSYASELDIIEELNNYNLYKNIGLEIL